MGNATLYRHFPTREDLLEEFYRDRIRPLREDARTLLATESPAWALHAWMLRFADWAGERRGIREALVAMSASGRFGTGPVCDEVQQVLAMVLETGATAGELRGDTDPADVGGILAGLLSVAGAPEQRPPAKPNAGRRRRRTQARLSDTPAVRRGVGRCRTTWLRPRRSWCPRPW
ncbi:TetR/AcrR family transcriptional regulator [Streptomyces sp. NBC_00121]|uniref:TetR/AcrR family transcriptional regulator n=1 Tax=unclassified Streptomyces TaxID=2593676 RepID=UPI00386C5F89